MSDNHAWVTLAQCQDVGELHALRAALEAHGVPCRIQGEHTHGIMGAFHGSMVQSRVLVPRPALAVARRLAADIVGPFEGEAPPTDEREDELPFRRQADQVAADEDDGPDEPAATLRPKSYGRLALVVFLGVGPLFGLGHVYAGHNKRAGALLLLTVVAVPAALQGHGWAWLLLAGIWLADVIGGGVAIAAHNRRVRELVRSAVPAVAVTVGA